MWRIYNVDFSCNLQHTHIAKSFVIAITYFLSLSIPVRRSILRIILKCLALTFSNILLSGNLFEYAVNGHSLHREIDNLESRAFALGIAFKVRPL